MQRLTITALIFVLGFAMSVRADDIHLQDGRVLKGRLISRGDGRVVFERPYGKVVFPASKVVKIVPGRSILHDYEELSSALKRDAVSGRLALARWCRAHRLDRQMKTELAKIVAVESDHAEARAMLGEEKVGDRWLSRREAMKARGFVRRDGRWMSRKEAGIFDGRLVEKRRLKKVQSRLNSLVRRIYGSSEKRSRKARTDLIKFGKKEKISNLTPIADQLYQNAARWRLAARSAIVEVRAQTAKITDFREITVNLGTGAPVRLQLPAIRTTRIGTTVGVPVR